METKNRKVTINKKQKLYVIPCGEDGYSCYGFDVVQHKRMLLADELGVPHVKYRTGSMKAYKEYMRLVEMARQKNEATGWRSQSDLYKPFIGNEGKRVEVVYTWGEKERFIIGRSTGWIPCHITIKRKDSYGGSGVLNDSIKSFRFV